MGNGGEMMTEREIENIFVKYPESKSYIELHSEIKITTTVSETPTGTGRTGSKVETKALQNVGPREIVVITEAVRAAATEDEILFMEYRYFKGFRIKMCCALLQQSRSNIYRVRDELLNKAKRIIKNPLL
jgi:hypothetical protein